MHNIWLLMFKARIIEIPNPKMQLQLGSKHLMHILKPICSYCIFCQLLFEVGAIEDQIPKHNICIWKMSFKIQKITMTNAYCSPKYGYCTCGSKNKPLFSHPNAGIASLIKKGPMHILWPMTMLQNHLLPKCLNPKIYPINSFICATYEFENWN
jgi:hypothetical protein